MGSCASSAMGGDEISPPEAEKIGRLLAQLGSSVSNDGRIDGCEFHAIQKLCSQLEISSMIKDQPVPPAKAAKVGACLQTIGSALSNDGIVAGSEFNAIAKTCGAIPKPNEAAIQEDYYATSTGCKANEFIGKNNGKHVGALLAEIGKAIHNDGIISRGEYDQITHACQVVQKDKFTAEKPKGGLTRQQGALVGNCISSIGRAYDNDGAMDEGELANINHKCTGTAAKQSMGVIPLYMLCFHHGHGQLRRAGHTRSQQAGAFLPMLSVECVR